jgi:hypothetical protein
MAKSNKKQIRKINVDDIEYHWVVNSHNCDGDGGSMFKIWLNKKPIYEELIHNTIITPKNVREKILEII